ncbi:hypothetical protein L1987_80499 [Smallanthus sonchifolius]|uniref:Uncharacterized protein n=1 Tax=Smallanthus sonchifolius TaxID=185202 RepID=A0ACB8YMW4_9ASTR|nr:hypothetical protein L1987_80499 [Smallanthus sonchifolius]
MLLNNFDSPTEIGHLILHLQHQIHQVVVNVISSLQFSSKSDQHRMLSSHQDPETARVGKSRPVGRRNVARSSPNDGSMWRVRGRVELLVVVILVTSKPRPVVIQTQSLLAEPTSGSSLASMLTACDPSPDKRRVRVEVVESAV